MAKNVSIAHTDRLEVIEIGTRAVSEVSVQGVVTISHRCTLRWLSPRGVFVHVNLLGADKDGFELADVQLSGWLEPDLGTTFSRSTVPSRALAEIAGWQLKLWWKDSA